MRLLTSTMTMQSQERLMRLGQENRVLYFIRGFITASLVTRGRQVFTRSRKQTRQLSSLPIFRELQ